MQDVNRLKLVLVEQKKDNQKLFLIKERGNNKYEDRKANIIGCC